MFFPDGIPMRKGRRYFTKLLKKLKKAGKNNEYDCIIGLSGGIDSSYMLYNQRLGVKTLVVHVDVDELELAVANIEKLIN